MGNLPSDSRSAQVLHFPPFRLDTDNGLLWSDNQLLHLHAKSQAVLRSLVEKAGQAVSLDEIRRVAWQGTVISTKNIKVYIRDIRKVLADDPKHPQFIETVPGVGYRFIGAIQQFEPRDQHRDIIPTSQGLSKEAPFLQETLFQPHTTRFVGRDKELAQLRTLLERALSGRRQFVFIAGEPGLGKTALVHALQEHLSSTPHIWTALGRCIEHYGVGEAYLPILDALTQLHTEEQRSVLIPLLQQHAPTWLTQLPSLMPEEHRIRSVTIPNATRERMLREFAQIIEALTERAPLVLILEDLHWSDPSTLDLLVAISQQRGASRLLLIGTYRPEAIYSGRHPLRSICQELQAHRLCVELTLTPLSESAIQAYLKAHFPTNAFPSSLASVLRERTEGNPLFLTSLLETFVARGIIDRSTTSWILTKPLAALSQETPESFRLLLERQIERLTPEEQQILAAGSVVGLEFSTAAVAYTLGKDVVDVEACCDSLARRHQFLRLADYSEWPDGERAACYTFLHALTREAWSERIPTAQKQRLHQRVGERLEAAYHGIEEEIAAELAMHFTAGHDRQRAIQYHQSAGEKATKQLAYHEAIFHYSSALSLLHHPPHSPASASLELQLQLALTQPLIAVKGWAAPETQQAYRRAHALSSTSGGLSAQFIALSGLWVVAYTRADLRAAHDLAQQLLRLARRKRKSVLQMEAYHALGNTLHRMGDLRSARTHLEQGIALYDRQRGGAPPLRHGLDDGVAGRGYAAWVLWALGYPDQARQKTEAMLTLARELSHPLHLAWALNSAAWHSQYQRTFHVSLQYANAELALCEEHHFAQLLAVGSIARGWALACLGKHRQGIRLMEEGLTAGQGTGAAIGQPRYLTVLAEAYGVAGENAKALDLLSRAEEIMTATKEFFYAAELHRLRGELLLDRKRTTRRAAAIHSSSSADHDLAEESFEKALAVSRRQQAKSFELRATMSLCHLWLIQGKPRPAYRLLKKIHGWFTEGFTTTDLQAARTLLEELNELITQHKKAPTASFQRRSALSQTASQSR